MIKKKRGLRDQINLYLWSRSAPASKLNEVLESWVVVSLLESREVNVFSLFKKLMTTIMQLACRHVHTSTDLDRPLWTSIRHAYHRTVRFSNVALHKQLIIHCIHTQLSMFQTHSCLFLVVFCKKLYDVYIFFPTTILSDHMTFAENFELDVKLTPISVFRWYSL